VKPGDPSPLLSLAEEDQQKLLVDEIASLKQEIMLKEEKLRKLKMAELYSKKDDLSNLAELTAKWRKASQEILVDLQHALPEPKPTIAELLRSYQIDAGLVKYNEDEESFV